MGRGKMLFFLGLAVALIPSLALYYLTWPLPGSQGLESVRWAYMLGKVTWLTEIFGGLIALVGLATILKHYKSWKTLVWVGFLVVLALGLKLVTWKLAAPQVFRPASQVVFAKGTSDELPPETLVMGITSSSGAKAYPIRLLAYHHEIEDELDGEPLWVTYCTMCRTGKIFRPEVDGQQLDFDLVGAVRYNSVYRDQQTGTYWYQANGKAAVGPMEGKVLPELRADQMTLANWLELYPDSDVLQPDPEATEGYKLFKFDTIDSVRSNPENPPGWQWVVGIAHDGEARGYLWADLAARGIIQDQIGDLPLVIQLHDDGISQRVWSRRVGDQILDLELDSESKAMHDPISGTTFGFDGVAVGGELEGTSLTPVPATVEFRHSFEYFSQAAIYEPPAVAATEEPTDETAAPADETTTPNTEESAPTDETTAPAAEATAAS